MRILINVPDLKRPGGVSSLFNILLLDKYYTNISIFVLHNKLPSVIRVPYKYIEFILRLINTDIVHLNPSLDRKSFLRDSFFAWITLFFRKKLIIYWHGWDEIYEEKIRNSIYLSMIFKHTFNKAQASVVLGTLFEKKLRALNYKNSLFVGTNAADNKYIEDRLPKKIEKHEVVRLLFLSRLETEKGIYIALETLKLLNQQLKRFKLVIAGSGSEEQNIKEIALVNEDVEWVGYVAEKQKHEILLTSHIMLIPSYSEGLPLTLLEGMIYGLPIVSSYVGGIPDILKDDINGYLIKSHSPQEYAAKIVQIIETPMLYNLMTNNNQEKSKSFNPKFVREQLYSIYEYIYKS